MVTTETKRPPRMKVKSKKVLRYILSALPFSMYVMIKTMVFVNSKIEKKIFKLMLKLNLLENYVK